MMTISENNTSRLFRDRTEAATLLAVKVKSTIQKDVRGNKKDAQRLVVLAIPRGGVVTGDVVASILNAELDIIVSRKIGAPFNSELAIGAVMHDGSFFPNMDIIENLRISKEYINEQISKQMKEIARRLWRFRASKGDYYDIQGKTVILVDDGIATGATIFNAIQWIRKQNPTALIVAVPVAPKDTIDKLRQIVGKIVVLHAPVLFGAVGAFYQDFSQVTDEEVAQIMSKYVHTTR